MNDARRRPNTMQRVGKPFSNLIASCSTSPPSCLELSFSRSVISRPSAVSRKPISSKWSPIPRTDAGTSTTQVHPSGPPPLPSLHLILFPTLPFFSPEISSSFFWFLRQQRDELSSKTSVFVQLARFQPAFFFSSLGGASQFPGWLR